MEWYIIAGIVIAVLVLGFLGYRLFEDDKQRLLRKARSFHKEAESCYESQEYDLAEKYYSKAEAMRKQALEKV